jgi:hypothetical protein
MSELRFYDLYKPISCCQCWKKPDYVGNDDEYYCEDHAQNDFDYIKKVEAQGWDINGRDDE